MPDRPERFYDLSSAELRRFFRKAGHEGVVDLLDYVQYAQTTGNFNGVFIILVAELFLCRSVVQEVFGKKLQPRSLIFRTPESVRKFFAKVALHLDDAEPHGLEALDHECEAWTECVAETWAKKVAHAKTPRP